MKVPAELKEAIAKCFKTKKAGDGWFPNSAAKNACINAITEAADHLGYGWEIAPGLIILHTESETRVFQPHNWWVGCTVDYWRKGKYYKNKRTHSVFPRGATCARRKSSVLTH